MPADSERFATMADAYDRMAPALVPYYELLQSEMLRLAAPEGQRTVLVDLGAGSGIFLEKGLARRPESTAYWVDSSEDFLRVARARLARFGERVTYVLSPLEEAWHERVEGTVDAVTSMSAIHHLTSDEKRDLYRRCHAVLRPGGWLLNADEMVTIHQDAYVRSLHRWVEHVDEVRRAAPPERLPEVEKWCEHFEGWKRRNIDEIASPKTKGDDLHESFLVQLGWLREAGFIDVDLLVKVHLWCLIGGRRL